MCEFAASDAAAPSKAAVSTDDGYLIINAYVTARAEQGGDGCVLRRNRSGRTVLYLQYRGRAMSEGQAWRAAHPGREIVINCNLFLQCDCTGRAHDVLTSASVDTPSAHALEERSGEWTRYPGVASGGGSAHSSTA